MGQNLLRSERESGRFRRGKRQRLVVAAGVQRLRPAQNGGQRLHGDPGNVVQRLLCLQGDATRLGVKP